MTPDDPLHALLPRYLHRRLAEDEAARFREHLAACDECRAEKEFLEQVRAEVEHHGEALLEDHPAAERLVALDAGDLPEGEAAVVRRHLEICATCSLESRWIAGDASFGRAPARSGARAWVWVWAAAAAAVLIALVTLPRLLSPAGPGPAFVLPTGLAPPERATAEGGTVVGLHVGDSQWIVYLSVDLEPTAFPAEIELLDEDGSTLTGTHMASRDVLHMGQYAFLVCPLTACPPGRYTIRIAPAGSGPVEEIPFHVRTN